MTVDISVKNMRIKCVVGYGPQENDINEKKAEFWKFIEEEVETARIREQGFILHFDGNLWAGSDIIPGDPRKQNKNGKLFQEFLSRNTNLVVVNSLPICKGLITRKRIKGEKEEKSVLDFFIVCTRVLPYVKEMVIDEEKEYILTNYKPARNGERAKDSDHFTQYLDIDIKVNPVKPVRNEIFHINFKASQETFKEITSNTNEFSNCFKSDEPFTTQVDNWRKVLKTKCQMAFKKIRIKNKNFEKKMNPKMAALIDIRNRMKNHQEKHTNAKRNKCTESRKRFSTKFCVNVHRKKHRSIKLFKCIFCGKSFVKRQQLMIHEKRHPEYLKRIEDLEKEIADLEAEENRNKIINNFENLSNNPENVNIKEVWNLLRKICPKFKTPLPIAKKDFLASS